VVSGDQVMKMVKGVELQLFELALLQLCSDLANLTSLSFYMSYRREDTSVQAMHLSNASYVNYSSSRNLHVYEPLKKDGNDIYLSLTRLLTLPVVSTYVLHFPLNFCKLQNACFWGHKRAIGLG
jgi:hypothetical protein